MVLVESRREAAESKLPAAGCPAHCQIDKGFRHG